MSIPNGDFKLAGTNIVNTPFSVVEGEAMALAEAMKEMLQRGLSYVVFESDSKIVVDAISSRQSCVSEFSLLISYIQSILSLHNYFEVKYVRRQANKTLPSLAFIEPLPLIDTVAQILGKDVYSKPITDADRVKTIHQNDMILILMQRSLVSVQTTSLHQLRLKLFLLHG
ncbi:protein argonaute [Trifolium repens]|nr:protein argonaute [Trifolium repens]